MVAKQGDKPYGAMILDEVFEKMELVKMEWLQRKSLKIKEGQSRGEDSWLTRHPRMMLNNDYAFMFRSIICYTSVVVL